MAATSGTGIIRKLRYRRPGAGTLRMIGRLATEARPSIGGDDDSTIAARGRRSRRTPDETARHLRFRSTVHGRELLAEELIDDSREHLAPALRIEIPPHLPRSPVVGGIDRARGHVGGNLLSAFARSEERRVGKECGCSV